MLISNLFTRIHRLEDQYKPANGRVFVVVTFGVTLALDSDACVQILRECGFVPTSGFVVVDLCKIPNGLKADETETYLRKDGSELCGPPPRVGRP